MVLGRIVFFLIIACWTAYGLAGPPRFESSLPDIGTPAPREPSRIVRIDRSTRYVAVDHFEVVTIANAQGHSFTWRFDTEHVPTGFPLRRVAPPGFAAGVVWVYVDYARSPSP